MLCLLIMWMVASLYLFNCSRLSDGLVDGEMVVNVYREMDSDNHKRPLLFPKGFSIAFSQSASDLPTLDQSAEVE